MLRVEREDWLVVLLAASVAAMACFQASDGDLGFHLATGREILATGRIPSTNVLSFGEPQHAWLLHQWLPAVLFEWLWQRGGIAALITVKMLIVSTTWLLSYATARSLGASACAATAACSSAACASAFRFEVRPYLFTHWTLALTWLAAARYLGAATTRQRGTALTLAAFAVVLGGQLHAGVVDSVLVMGLFALGMFLEAKRAGRTDASERLPSGAAAAAQWLVTAAFATGCTAFLLVLYHPLSARMLAFPFEMATERYWGEHLVEFRRAWAFPWRMLSVYWLWLSAVVLTLWLARRQLHAGFIVAALAYAVISLCYVRMAYAFALISAPPIAAGWTGLAHAWLEPISLARKRAARRISALALLAVACTAPLYVYRDHAPGFGLVGWVWPLQHFAFIRTHDVRGRAFVSDAWAGPFLGFFYPQRKVFFDNRLEAYSGAFARNVYQRIRYGQAGWDRLLDQYQVDVVLLRYTTPGEAHWQHGAANLRQHLAHDQRYRLVYFDDDGELFVRNAQSNSGLIAGFGLPGIDPDRRVFLQRPSSCLPALLHAAQAGNRSSTLLGLTAVAMADAGDAGHALELLQSAVAQATEDAWLQGIRARLLAGSVRPNRDE